MHKNPVAMSASTALILLLALVSSACIVVSSGPNENRAETFEFIPVPVDRREAVEAFREQFLGAPAILDEETITPIGKIETSAGSIIFADFQIVDPEMGRQQCSGSASPTGGGWGCGPLGQEPPEDVPLEDMTLSVVGGSGRWSHLELRVGSDVSHLEAIADDGTSYRMEPIAGYAWMEWKTDRGDLVITAFDREGEPLGSVETDAT